MDIVDIVQVVKDSGVDNGGELIEAFGGPFEEAGVILKDYKNIIVENELDITTMHQARQARLQLRQARITVENKRKELKSDFLKKGQAIDSIARFVKEQIEPAEKYLETQEKYAEILNEKREIKKELDRIDELSNYISNDEISIYKLRGMSDEEYGLVLSNAKELSASRRAEAEKIEKERLAKEKEEADERERIRKENEELRAKNEALRKEQEEKDRIAREEMQKIEAENLKIRQEQEAKELAEAQEKARVEAENLQKMTAPDKDKLKNYADTIQNVIDLAPSLAYAEYQVKANNCIEMLKEAIEELR